MNSIENVASSARHPRIASVPVVVVLLAIVGLFATRQYLTPVFTDDDALFFDVSYHLLEQHRMATDPYGSVAGSDVFVAGMPFLYPALTIVDVVALRALHHVFVVKTTALLLLSALFALAARSIGFRSFSIGSTLLLVLVFTDGWVANAFGSLRYDGWLIIVTAAMYLAMRRAIDRGGWRDIVLLLASLVVAAVSHWQLLAVIVGVLFNVAVFGLPAWAPALDAVWRHGRDSLAPFTFHMRPSFRAIPAVGVRSTCRWLRRACYFRSARRN